MNRTYKLKHLANKGKQMKVIKTVRPTGTRLLLLPGVNGGVFMSLLGLSISNATLSILGHNCLSVSSRLVSIR